MKACGDGIRPSSARGPVQPHRQRDVAQVDVTGRALVEVVAAVAAGLHRLGEGPGVGAQHPQRRALVGGHIAGQADRSDRRALCGVFVEAHRIRPAPGRAEQFHALEHAADQGDVAVELARRLAGDHVQLGADAAVLVVVAAGADRTVAVRQPGVFAVAGHGEIAGETGPCGPAVAVGQGGEGQSARGPLELGGQVGLRAAQRPRLGRVVGVGIAELDHEVVLRTVDAGAVPEALACQGADVVGVFRREFRRQFDDDATAVQVHVQQVVGGWRVPVAVRRSGEDFLHAAVLGRRIGGQHRQRGQRQGQGQGQQGRA